MNFKGRARVPPNCLAAVGRSGVEDLATTTMKLIVHDCEANDAGNLTTTEAYVSFTEESAEEACAVSNSLLVPIDSETSNQARDLANEIDKGNAESLEKKVQGMLCDRVLDCHGEVNGECWALGASAVGEVINSVINELE